ncbi:MAG: GDP-mannose 4,6-dehydratase [Chloroflexi bacterium]|nr:GDP-mannose 4,6-dehydratase [Chloroflexota bacterium]
MRCLVTGCAGFIGARLAQALLRSGHDVVGIDNIDTAYDPNLKRWRLSRLTTAHGFDFREIDIRDRGALTGLFRVHFDSVFHLAGKAGVRASVEDPGSYIDTNVTGTLHLIDLACKSGAPKFVFASTSSAYGDRQNGAATEDSPSDRPLSPYAASKKAAEVLCHAYHLLHGIDVSVLRYFTVYGPAGRPDMSIFRFVRWIREGDPVLVFGDGSQKRDFTYVDDIVSGTIAAQRRVGYEVINLGSDAPVMLMDVIRRVENLTEKRAKIEFRPQHAADVSFTHANIAKARQVLGWVPEVPVSEGLARVVAWYEENRGWARELN